MVGPKTAGVLYHYTSQHTLWRIVESRTLWISNVYYMNDANEIRYGAELFRTVVAARHGQESTNEIKDFLSELGEWINQLTGVPHYIFVFSLTEKGNLLSQWRGYTPRGGVGVSIGFSKARLEAAAKAKGLALVKCIYKWEEQSEILNAELESILSEFAVDSPSLQTSGRPPNQKYLPYLYRHSERLLKTFCRLKDPFFEEESEWRLVSRYYEKYTDPDIRFREAASTMIPFIEFELSGIHNDSRLFEQVYVGPAPHSNLAFSAISSFLSNKRACNMTINSGSPLRSI